MTAATFLSLIWPAQGPYVLATPYTLPGTTTRVYAHKTFDSIDAAAQYAEQWKSRTDLFFAVHSLKTPRVWNPAKPDRRTGELGAYEVRVQSNMAAAKCFFLDLDVGASAQKYASQAEALGALKQFCQTTRLPKPMITSSGGGLHVYWVLSDALDSVTWKVQAHLLKQLTRHHGLKADPARTTDSASVLRVAGTFNRKTPLAPRPVRVLTPGTVTPPGILERLLRDAITRAGVTPLQLPVFQPDTLGLGSNMEVEYDGPPVTFRALVTACRQMQHLAVARGNVSEPEWYHSINLTRFVEHGMKFVHKLSEGHPDYDAGATEAKVAQLVAKGIKPTSCAKLAEVCGEERCVGCPFAGKVKSPIVAARYKDSAPAPVVVQDVGLTLITTEVPPPPFPYLRMKGGGIAFEGTSKDGDEVHTTLFPHDLYPVRRLVNGAAAVEQHVWCVVLPREGPKEFVMDADALYDRRKFLTTIANHGVFPTAGNVPYLQDYMIAYISELQRLTDADDQCTHLGWTDEHQRFILPDKILCADGTAKPAMLSVGAGRATAAVHKKGTLQRQVELLRFYAQPGYLANQFYIVGSLAAPLFYATGHHGVVVNASGEAGASKSTSLYTAASFWGQPELYPINGTNNGATMRGRAERVTTLANLPVCVDEITHMPIKDAIDLAMGITQPGHRIRLDTNGVERSSAGGQKATIMLVTANNSLHGMLSVDNAAGTAGSMRVVELLFKAQKVHQKSQADAYLHELKQNYGHIGEAFLSYVIRNREAVEQRVRTVMEEIDLEAQIQSSERFWSAAIAAILVAAEVAAQCGLLAFSAAQLKQWALQVQIPYMRGVVRDEYTTPLGVLAEYLEQINGEILVAAKIQAQANITNVVKAPRGQLLAHYDTDERVMWVLKKGFKDYCVRTGAHFLKILDELSVAQIDESGRPSRVLASKNVRKVLGAGTEFAKAQSWCFAINMDHPDVSGAVGPKLVATPTTPLEFPKRATA
jgi:Domain of unknown function (DUF927)